MNASHETAKLIKTIQQLEMADKGSSFIDKNVMSAGQNVILSMLHGVWQQRSVSLIVGFNIPELLCNSDQPLSIDAIAAAAGCNSSKLLYPVMKVLAQWGIGEEMENKHFIKNQGMELLRRDKGPSLGHLAHYYGSEEHFLALGMLSECVRHGKPAFQLQHGMSTTNYMNDITSHPYSESKMVKGSSEHKIGSSERRREFAENYISAMACMSNLTLLQHQEGINNIYEVYPWSTCKRLVDVGGSTGHFIASIMKRPECEHIQGYVMDLPDVVDEAEKSVSDLGLNPNRITFIKQDIMKPICNQNLQADTVMMTNFWSSFVDEDKVSILKNCKSLFGGNGRVLIIDICSPNPGNSKHNIGLNGRQVGFVSIHLVSACAVSYSSVKETADIIRDIGTKAGYKLNQIYNTFPGGYTVFEIVTL